MLVKMKLDYVVKEFCYIIMFKINKKFGIILRL